MRLLRPVLLALLALLLVPLTATPAQAADGRITGVAKGPDGKPLEFLRWEVFENVGGEWRTLPFGPKLTDAKGRFSWTVPQGKPYRVCFFDDNYLYGPSSTGFWQPEVRHRDTCWPNTTSVQSATSWTPTAAAPSKTFAVSLPRQGLGMAPVEPFWVGSFRTGQPITIVGQEGWRPTNATFTYRWMSRKGSTVAPIAGATSATFTPTAAQDGAWIWVEVTASRAGYKPATLTTPSTMVGGTQHVQPTSPLAITGTAQAGSTITASFGKPANTYSELEWFVDGVPQPKAKTYNAATSRFTVATAHAGAKIDARLKIYKNDVQGNYVDGSDAYQRAQVQVAGSRPAKPLAAAPRVAGTPTVGRTLAAPARVTADSTATVSYQWLRGSTAIKGATKSRYRVTSSDVNKTLKVRVSVRRPGWWNPYVSTSRATVGKRALKTGTVKVSGTAKVGRKLTAKTAKWGPRPVKVRYRWLRNGQAIKGATRSTYKVRKSDKGKVIRVRVTVSKAKYLTVTKNSAGRKIRR